MKIAYLSPIFFSDVDLSFLHELQKIAEVYYFIPIGPLKKAAAINIDEIYPKSGVFPASIYPELEKFGNIIDLSRTYIINRTASHVSKPQNIKVYLQLCRILENENFDIVHITEFPLYTQFPLYRFRKKMVISVHDPIPHVNVTSLRSKLQRRVGFRLVDNYILFNKAQKDDFISYYHLKKKNIYDSDLSAYTYLKAYNVAEPKVPGKYILFFGWIRKGKGLEYLLPAMHQVNKKYPDLKLIVAGKGGFYFDMNDYGDKDYIQFFHRFIPDDELANLIANSQFVVVPYTEATQSGVIMSAYAFQKPVIATNVGGLPEMLEKEKYGLCVEHSSTPQLVDAILELLDNPSLLKEKAENIGDDYFNGDKSWYVIAKELLENCYTKIIKNK